MTPHPHNRNQLGDWLNQNGFTGEGAEIGCAYGGFSQIILSEWKGQKLYMVDPWSKQQDYRENTNEIAPFDEWYKACAEMAKARTEAPYVGIVRQRSADAANTFRDGQFDFVYIDGNHRYENVSEDLRLWWPKVKTGGLVGGHDYGNITMEQQAGWDCEVQRAVEDFVREMNLSVPHLTECSSFWFRKS